MSKRTSKFNEMPNSFIEYIGKPNAKVKIRRVRPITKKPKLIPNKPKGFSEWQQNKKFRQLWNALKNWSCL